MQISAIGDHQVGQRGVGGFQATQVGADGLQIVEVVRDRIQHLVLDRRQGLAQFDRELAGLDPVADRRAAQAVEQMNQIAVPAGVADAEDLAAHPSAVVPGIVQQRAVTQRLPEPLDRHRLAVHDQVHVDADPQRGDQIGEPGLGGRGRPAYDGAQGEEVLDAVLVHAAQLEPGESLPVHAGRALAHQPAEGGPAGPGRIDALRVAVEQERQQHLQSLGLARAVLAAKQEPAVLELEHLIVVLPDVADPGAVQPVTKRMRGHGRTSSVAA
jgi:hypothetical protein